MQAIESKYGFSLIELLVVVAIIGILAAVGTLGYSNYMETTKRKVLVSNAEAVTLALKTFAASKETGVGCLTWNECYDYVENQIWRNPYNATDIHTVYFALSCGADSSNVSIKQKGAIIVNKNGDNVTVGFCDENNTYQPLSAFEFH